MGTAPNSRANRQDDLIRAGWQVIDELPLERALGGFTTAAVAATAGVTTGSFFHHYSSAADFADALVLDMRIDEIAEEDRITELFRIPDADLIDVVELMHRTMRGQWQEHAALDERQAGLRHEMLVWACHNRALAGPRDGLATAGDVIGQRIRRRETSGAMVWKSLLDTVGRTFVEPFTVERLSVGLTALFYGLAIRHAVDPDAVDDDLFADLVGVLVATLTKPVGSDRRLADVSGALARSLTLQTEASPQARSGARRRAETRARIVARTIGMFAGGWEDVTASEVADRAGVSAQTVANAFGGVRAVAAQSFMIHLEPLAAAAAGAARDPLSVTAAVLRELAGRALLDPEPARALIAERLAAAARFGDAVPDGDVRVEVPLGAELLGPLGEMQPLADPATSADMLVNFVLCQAVARMGDAEEITHLALRLLGPAGDPAALAG